MAQTTAFAATMRIISSDTRVPYVEFIVEDTMMLRIGVKQQSISDFFMFCVLTHCVTNSANGR